MRHFFLILYLFSFLGSQKVLFFSGSPAFYTSGLQKEACKRSKAYWPSEKQKQPSDTQNSPSSPHCQNQIQLFLPAVAVTLPMVSTRPSATGFRQLVDTYAFVFYSQLDQPPIHSIYQA